MSTVVFPESGIMADEPRQSEAIDTLPAPAPAGALPASTPKPRRRWYQFSLRTLLVVMVGLCLCAAWVAFRLRQAEANRNRLATIQEAIDWVEEVGGRHDAKSKTSRSRSWLEQLFDDPGGVDDPAEDIVVSRVYLGHGPLAFSQGPQIQAKSDASEVVFVSDFGGISSWGPMISYFDNNPDPSRVTDAGLENLKSLFTLIELRLDETAITDAGLAGLEGLTNLSTINLEYTQVTDAGLDHLKRLSNLRELSLYATHVTDEGESELRRALPNCEIHH